MKILIFIILTNLFIIVKTYSSSMKKFSTSFLTIKVRSTTVLKRMDEKVFAEFRHSPQIQMNKKFLQKNRDLSIFKENGGEKKFPSIHELAKQQQLKTLMDEYKKNGQNIFENTIDFPCEFQFKIIGTNDITFLSDTLNTVAKSIGDSPNSIKHSTKITSGGKYLSITMSPMFISSKQIYDVYEEISKDSRVKFMI